MAGFYKIVLRGTAEGQDINNILYYSTLTPDILVFDPDVAFDLGEAALSAWQTQMLAQMPNTYTAEGADVSMVDEDGIVTSPFTVTVSDPVPGAKIDQTGSVGVVAIAKFNCIPAVLANTRPVPKRSYLAIGPLTEAAVGPDGSFLLQATYQPLVEAATVQGHLIGATQFVAYRVGRTIGADLAGVGRVSSVVVRPFSSFRRSRLLSPTGK